MVRVSIARLSIVVVLLAFVGGVARQAAAFPAMQAAFYKEYLTDSANPDYVKMVKTEAKCGLCHQGKKSKKNRNAYGAHLAELVDMKKDARNADKLKEALVTVAAMHSVEGDATSPTYGELIAEGKLPGGDLKAAIEEPKTEEK